MVTVARLLFQNLVQDQRSNEKMLFFKNKTSVTSMDSTKKIIFKFYFPFFAKQSPIPANRTGCFFCWKTSFVLFCLEILRTMKKKNMGLYQGLQNYNCHRDCFLIPIDCTSPISKVLRPCSRP